MTTDDQTPAPAPAGEQDRPASPAPGESLVEAKQALRARVRAARRARVAEEDAVDRERQATAIAEAVVDYAEARGARTLTAFESMPTEPPTEALVRALVGRGIRVLMPVTLPDLDLDWQEVLEVAPPSPRETVPTATSATAPGGTRPRLGGRPVDSPYTLGAPLGTDAIALADVVLTPGLSVDRSGRRLGQGGGCYDRALPRRSGQSPVITLVHDDELVDGPLPVGDLDELVDGVVTASAGVVELNPGT